MNTSTTPVLPDPSTFHPTSTPSALTPELPRPTFTTATVINRTHRVIRERAEILQARRSRQRSLWIPLAVCAALVVMSSHSIWSLLVQYEHSPTGIPDASGQIFVFLLWFLPVTAALLAAVLLRKTRSRTQNEFPQ